MAKFICSKVIDDGVEKIFEKPLELNIDMAALNKLIDRDTAMTAKGSGCPQCGHFVLSLYNFCPHCGQRLFVKEIEIM